VLTPIVLVVAGAGNSDWLLAAIEFYLRHNIGPEY
jgi:hypothetical protein